MNLKHIIRNKATGREARVYHAGKNNYVVKMVYAPGPLTPEGHETAIRKGVEQFNAAVNIAQRACELGVEFAGNGH